MTKPVIFVDEAAALLNTPALKTILKASADQALVKQADGTWTQRDGQPPSGAGKVVADFLNQQADDQADS